MSLHVQFPDEAWLRDIAGDGAYKRGVGYFKDGAISLSQVSADALAGEAHGSHLYPLWFKWQEGAWRWYCSCPAAEGRALCKHLVAAVLVARAGADGGSGEQSSVAVTQRRPRATAKAADLSTFLRAQPAQRLADWLLAMAREDRDIEKRLRLYQASSEPGAMQEALSKALSTGGFMDYRRTLDYAHRLMTVIELLGDVLQRDPAECRGLCEYALKRLFKAVLRIDDSAGAVGECMAEIAALHAQACRAEPPGKSLAKSLWALQAQDDWGLLPIAEYWEALGAQGQLAYAKLVVDVFERLPPIKPRGWDAEGFKVSMLTEALARCRQDFDLLQRVLRRDLSTPRSHLQVVDSLRESGRAREAMAFAENAVKQFPKAAELRAALAECLLDAGLGEDALEQVWVAFQHQPDGERWDALKLHAGTAWPQWREKALAHVTEKATEPAGQRLRLLLHDGDSAAAIALAYEKPVDSLAMHTLADHLKNTNPVAAAAFYLRLAQSCKDHLHGPGQYKDLVGWLAKSARCERSSQLLDFVAGVRAAHARKTRLLWMLDEAGL